MFSHGPLGLWVGERGAIWDIMVYFRPNHVDKVN
jgi:hypothetical protein